MVLLPAVDKTKSFCMRESNYLYIIELIGSPAFALHQDPIASQEKKEVFKEELDMDLKPTALADVP